jgi:hypothetical protein
MDANVQIVRVRQQQNHATSIEFVDGTVITLSALLLAALKKLYAAANPNIESLD